MGGAKRWVKVPWCELRLMFLASNSLLNLRGQNYLCLCYHARHLQQIHWSKLLCGIYGFMAKSSVSRLNILRLLIRFLHIALGKSGENMGGFVRIRMLLAKVFHPIMHRVGYIFILLWPNEQVELNNGKTKLALISYQFDFRCVNKMSVFWATSTTIAFSYFFFRSSLLWPELVIEIDLILTSN